MIITLVMLMAVGVFPCVCAALMAMFISRSLGGSTCASVSSLRVGELLQNHRAEGQTSPHSLSRTLQVFKKLEWPDVLTAK